MSLIKRAWRGLRGSQPFNRVATHLARWALPAGRLKHHVSEHLPYQGVVHFELPDGRVMKLMSHGDEYITNQIFWTRRYEPELSTLFFNLARHARCTLDVGAHVGFYALLTGFAHTDNQVYAFEPLKRIFDRLQDNVQLNGISNVRTFHSAVGREAGSIEFFHIDSPYLPSNSSTRKQTFVDSGQRFSSTTVPVISLDQFCQDQTLKKIDLIKMDTEGTELDVLYGAEAILQRDHPTILCEVLTGLADVQALERFLGPLGYRFYRLEGSGPVPLERIQSSVDWWNYLFSPLAPDALKRTLGIPGSSGR